MSIEKQISIPTDSFVSRAQRDSLVSVLRGTKVGNISSQAQRQIVREILTSAEISGRTPEQCVVAFKALLNEAAANAGFALGRDRTNLQEKLVTLFIEEMYRAAPTVTDENRRGTTASSIIPAGTLGSPAARP
jgi:hypothetical protein